MFNIHHDLNEVVQGIKKEFMVPRLQLISAIMVVAVLIVCFVSEAPLPLLVVLLMVGLWACVATRYVSLRDLKVSDKWLCILVEIKFNQYPSGKPLVDSLKETGYITYFNLECAQRQYNEDNARDFQLHQEGAAAFLTNTA